ncbi:1208_t:CDS:2, partial [Entrophospora sp. SA101]
PDYDLDGEGYEIPVNWERKLDYSKNTFSKVHQHSSLTNW